MEKIIIPLRIVKIKSENKSQNELFESKSEVKLIQSKYIKKLISDCNISSDILEKIESTLGEQVLVAFEQEPIDTRKFHTLKAVILGKYNFEMLTKLNSQYLYHFYSGKNEIRYVQAKKLKKDELVQLFTLIFCNKVLFEKLFSLLPEDVKQVLNFLVWEGGAYPAEKLIDELGANILNKISIKNSDNAYRFTRDNPPSYYISDSYTLFYFKADYLYHVKDKCPYNFTVSLDETLGKELKKYLPKPEGYDLTVIESIDKTDFVYFDSDEILRNIDLFKNYILQGYVKTGKNGKALTSAIHQMANYCHINEFYGQQNGEQKDKALQYLRTQLIMDFFMIYTLKAGVKDELQFLKNQFSNFFAEKNIEINPIFNTLLSHIKGYSYYSYDQHRRDQIKKAFADILVSLPLMKWVSVENIIKYSIYRDIFLEVVENREYILGRLYLKAKVDKKILPYQYNDKINVTNTMYHDVITTPFVKGMLFLMASFGIVDIAYNYPSNTSYQQIDKSYLTEYDGLRYVRLTELGAFVLGITDNYNVKTEKEEATIILDDKRLMIRIEGKEPLKEMILEKLAEKIQANNYKVTYSSFLKDCDSVNKVEQKIKLFKKHISPQPSEIWQKFFKEVQCKLNPLVPKTSLVVYEIQQNSELINLIAKDEILRKYILKAEKYHIVLEALDRSKVKKRLEEFGFFVDNM